MITNEEKDKLFLEFEERMYLRMSSIIGSLITEHMGKYRLKQEVLSQHKEFKEHPDIVASVLMQTEAENTLDDMREIVRKAIPEIERRIERLKGIDVHTLSSSPNTKILNETDNGEI
jgi:hypothetical protein